MNVRQVVPWEHWPSGNSKPIAIVPFNLSQLAERYGLGYTRGIDDLDEYSLSAIELANGRQAWLYRHDSDPSPGTVVYVDAHDDIEEAQALLAKALGIPLGAMSWRAPALLPA